MGFSEVGKVWLFTWVARKVRAAENGCRATRLGENVDFASMIALCSWDHD